MSRHIVSSLVVACAVAAFSQTTAHACPFCNQTSLTFCEEIMASDVAVVAKLIERAPATDPLDSAFDEEPVKSKFEILKVLRGAKTLGERKLVENIYFGQSPVGSTFLLIGIDPPNVNWSTPIVFSDRGRRYLETALALPKEGATRLAFFQKYLEDKDEMLARDAYDEFAKSPFKDVKDLKDKMDRHQLLAWIKDPEMAASRRRLYLTMLSVCGTDQDADMLEKLIASGDRRVKSGFDAMIGCYLTLRGEPGLKLIEDRFLRHDKIDGKRVEYSDTYSAIQALRFHGQEAHVLTKKRVVRSLRLMLDRKKLADLVIPDLARWEDWESMGRLVELFKKSDPETTWVRTPILLYLQACPLPEAKAHLEQLAKLDPESYERAAAFAPLRAGGLGADFSADAQDQGTKNKGTSGKETGEVKKSAGVRAAPAESKSTKPAASTRPKTKDGAIAPAADRSSSPAPPTAAGVSAAMLALLALPLVAVLLCVALPSVMRSAARRRAGTPA